MWKLLPVCFLVACAVTEPQKSTSGENQSTQGRIVRQVELPLESPAQTVNGQPSRKSFQGARIQGWLDETGAWHIRTDVHHGRLRCGIYEAGIQLGRGNPACSNVEWLTGVEYATRLRHCNSASRPHAGGGKFSNAANRFEEATCVRVVVRCEGTC
jgi:hypothetical protein